MFDTIFISEIMESVLLPFKMLINPHKRIYYLYWISSLALALWALRDLPIRGQFAVLFDKKIWFSRSSYIDISFIFFNSFVKVLLLAPLFLSIATLSFTVRELCINNFGRNTLIIEHSVAVILYTIIVFIVHDFISFIIHYLMHRISFLWRFHKIHHSAPTLTPFTQYRIHPIELFINNISFVCISGILMGIFDYITEQPISPYTVLGVNICNFLFLLCGANLRHSHIPFSYPSWVERIFISPSQHQIHHSKDEFHWDKNFGSKCALWDYLFGTLVLSNKKQKVDFGISHREEDVYKTFIDALSKPFGWKKR